MRAIRLNSFGAADVLQLDNVPRPAVGRSDVLIRVAAAGVNPIDSKIRSGRSAIAHALPLTLGCDVAGTIEAVGAEVENFRIGEAVIANMPGDEGGYAEYAALPAHFCARKPATSDCIRAAAIPLAALGAWQGLFDVGGLKNGQKVLILGASGGVGHFAVQFARWAGALVIGVCRTESEFVAQLGAHRVIENSEEAFATVEEVDLALDLIGGESQQRCWSVLKAGGMLVSTRSDPNPVASARDGMRGAFYETAANAKQLALIADLVDGGAATPHVDAVFPLSSAAAAHRHLEAGGVRGKVVLDLS